MKKDKAVAFLCGDCSVTLYVMLGGIGVDLGHFALKVLATVILGAAGGIAGIAGKDIYQRLRPLIHHKLNMLQNRFNKRKKRTDHGNNL